MGMEGDYRWDERMNMQKCAVVVNSSDSTFKYLKGWNWFWQTHWNKGCEWPVYLLTESHAIDFEGVKNLVLGKQPWATYLANAFNTIDADYVFFMMDDHFPLLPLHPSLFKDALMWCRHHDWNRMGFYRKYHKAQAPSIERQTFNGYRHYEHTAKSGYKLCLQPSLWKTSFMMDCMDPSFSPWQFEWEGSKRVSEQGISYLQVDGWYAEAYQQGKPRPGDYEHLISQYDWEV